MIVLKVKVSGKMKLNFEIVLDVKEIMNSERGQDSIQF